jgi:hypothetical protein
MMGGLWSAGWDKVAITLPFIVLSVPVFTYLARDLNALLMGEESAADLGIEVEATKRFILALTALTVGACVAVSGVIGFVGLIIPHVTRLFVGPDHKVLIPASALVGGIFLIVTDLFARMVIRPSELPVGIITSLFGVRSFFRFSPAPDGMGGAWDCAFSLSFRIVKGVSTTFSFSAAGGEVRASRPQRIGKTTLLRCLRMRLFRSGATSRSMHKRHRMSRGKIAHFLALFLKPIHFVSLFRSLGYEGRRHLRRLEMEERL